MANPIPANEESDAAVDPGDEDLAAAAANGDVEAFELLYRRNAGRVYGLCLRLCDGDAAKAAQAAQDAFVRAWEKLSTFRGESRFSTWMHRLTVNVVLGERRLLRRWTTFEAAAPEAEVPAEHLGPAVEDPEGGLTTDLERAFSRLPRGARTVLWLHDVEGYLHEEIAELTGIAIGTSKAQLHRARRQMKELLQ